MKLLVINPGSTSTKVGVFTDGAADFELTLRHSANELMEFPKVSDQYEYRKEIILKALEENGIKTSEFDAIVGRGGLVRPIEGGAYEVNNQMLKDLHDGFQGEHASNLGGLIAHEIAKSIGKKAYIVDPVVVDELSDVARISGHPAITRRSIFHALNQRAIAHIYADEAGKKYNELNLIVVHMGGGISVGAHMQGRVIDVNNALDGDGPFSPERSGSLPVGDLVALCFSGEYDHKQVKNMIKPQGGLMAYLGTTDFKQLMERQEDDPKVRIITEAMMYQISKEIGAMAVVLDGKVDAILLTGGLCYSNVLVDYITQKVKFIAPIKAYPGEDELRALYQGVARGLSGEENLKIY